jgi:hypothetical protein
MRYFHNFLINISCEKKWCIIFWATLVYLSGFKKQFVEWTARKNGFLQCNLLIRGYCFVYISVITVKSHRIDFV